jgi:F0F1-type ATP synthase membrane subunit b/b'
MDNVIRRIIAIEDQAQEIISSIKEKEEQLNGDVEREALAISKNIEEQSDKKIEQIKVTENEYLNAQIEVVRHNTSVQLEKINSIYNENKQQWSDTVFENVIKVRS